MNVVGKSRKNEVRNMEKNKKLHEDITKKAPNRNLGEKRVRMW